MIGNMKKVHNYFIYILSNKKNGTLYIGVTNKLLARTYQHKNKLDPASFTAQHDINKLVYYENYQFIEDALTREKQLKKWHRSWKIKLIEKENPYWRDLTSDME
jgi:putative endonuclease